MDPIKKMIESMLYPYMEKRKGNRIRANTAELLQSQFASAEELRSLQERKLRGLLLRCSATVPAYRDFQKRGITENMILAAPFEALALIPPAGKVEIRENLDLYTSSEVAPETLIANSTGGSTAQPFKFFMDRYTVEYYEAARWRGLSWYDISPGSRSYMIWGNPLELNAVAQAKAARKERLLKNRRVLSAYDLSPQKVMQYKRDIEAYHPEYLYGYAGALATLARLFLDADQRPALPLKAVVSTAESLSAERRALIALAFGAPVVDEYGARDGGILAYECPAGGLHITSENCILEVLDPLTLAPLPAGETGLICVTDLNNLSAPRLRYLVGDTGALAGEPCTCGRHLPLLREVGGREDAIFQLPDGTLIHGNVINQLARNSASILAIQLVQQAPDRALLSIVRKEAAGAEALTAPDTFASAEEENCERIYIDSVRAALPGVAIAVRFVSEIPKPLSGKTRYAIRDFPLR